MKEQNAYILGTDKAELYRLGLQHQVWASEAQKGWDLAGFNAGQTLLDLGCGPGFCTKELAFVVGEKGKIIGVDKSEAYINYVQQLSNFHSLNIEGICADFDSMVLQNNSLDGMYCRWALAWLSNPKAILQKVVDALKPGGTMVIHEYYNWSNHQIEPQMPHLSKAIAGALKSFKESEGEIDIGRELPRILTELDMKIVNIRPMQKLATPQDLTWQWPASFYEVYFPKLVEMNYLSDTELKAAFEDLKILENTKGASLCCPMMIEVIAEKV